MKVIWLTGLPCSGKSTIAQNVARHRDIQILDGDVIREKKQNKDFSYEGRVNQARNVALAADKSSKDVIVALVSPFAACRDVAREVLKDRYIEVYVKCSLDTCIARDVKGMYKRAMNGEIKDFTGISSPYEIPKDPHLVLDTNKLSIEQCSKLVQSLLS